MILCHAVSNHAAGSWAEAEHGRPKPDQRFGFFSGKGGELSGAAPLHLSYAKHLQFHPLQAVAVIAHLKYTAPLLQEQWR